MVISGKISALNLSGEGSLNGKFELLPLTDSDFAAHYYYFIKLDCRMLQYLDAAPELPDTEMVYRNVLSFSYWTVFVICIIIS